MRGEEREERPKLNTQNAPTRGKRRRIAEEEKTDVTLVEQNAEAIIYALLFSFAWVRSYALIPSPPEKAPPCSATYALM